MNEEVIASDLRAPWAIAFLPDGRAMFTEREGRVRVIRDGRLLPEPALVVPDIKSWSKMGLLGLAIDPGFAANRFVYLAESYGDASRDNRTSKENFVRVVRYREAEQKLVEPKTLIERIPCFHNHAGGRLRFGPDGKLYVTTGDADRPPLAQDLTSLCGKILRLNTDGSIPADNPFVGRADAHPAIWSYGHRNAQGLAFQPVTNALYAPEHGPDGGDEVNLVMPGQNYGWPVISHRRTREGMLSPLVEFTPSIGPAAATFYDADLFPGLKGDLLVGAMRGESIVRVRLDGQQVVSVDRLLFRKHGRIREVAVAPDGAIWITTSEFDPPEGRRNAGYDQIVRLAPTGTDLAAIDAVPDARTLPRPVGAEAIFAQTCAACHGQTVVNALQPSLFDAQWNFGADDESVLRNVRYGIPARGMPAFDGKLTDAEMTDVVRYIRQRGAAGATPVEPVRTTRP